MTTTSTSDLMCPSATFDRAVTVLGMGAPGKPLHYRRKNRPHEIVEGDLSAVRLAGMCISTGCLYWNDRCELGRSVAQSATQLNLTNMPQCSIRTSCRWFAENGRAACGGCALVRYS
jgi:hypothetical protein